MLNFYILDDVTKINLYYKIKITNKNTKHNKHFNH